MSNHESHIHHHPQHGTFAEGQAMPEAYAGEDQLGTFATGEAMPDLYADDQVGTFATGHAMPDVFPDEERAGSFADEDERTT